MTSSLHTRYSEVFLHSQSVCQRGSLHDRMQSAEHRPKNWTVGIGGVYAIDDNMGQACVAVDPSLTLYRSCLATDPCGPQLSDDKLRLCSEKISDVLAPLSLPARTHAADDKTTTDLHAAQDKDGLSGSGAQEFVDSQATSEFARQTLGCLSASRSCRQFTDSETAGDLGV